MSSTGVAASEFTAVAIIAESAIPSQHFAQWLAAFEFARQGIATNKGNTHRDKPSVPATNLAKILIGVFTIFKQIIAQCCDVYHSPPVSCIRCSSIVAPVILL